MTCPFDDPDCTACKANEDGESAPEIDELALLGAAEAFIIGVQLGDKHGD